MTDKEKKALEKKLSTLDQLGVIPAKENIEDQDHLDCEPSLLPIKKRRISQDQRLALSMIGMNGNDGNDDSSRRTRRRLN
jgi:DNA-binding helix-hairpin-helix protein with protein kinase domain